MKPVILWHPPYILIKVFLFASIHGCGRTREQLNHHVGVFAPFFPDRPTATIFLFSSRDDKDIWASEVPLLELLFVVVDREVARDVEIIADEPSQDSPARLLSV
jgi:hypothetical protein